MGSLKIPESPVEKAPVPSLHKSSSGDLPLRSNTVSVYAAAALSANNIRRQRSDTFVQQKTVSITLKPKEEPRAPSQICLSRHRAISFSAPDDDSDSESDDDDSTSSSSSSNSSAGSSSHRTAESPATTITISSSSNNSSSSNISNSNEAGAIIEGVLIRRAVRPSPLKTNTASNNNSNPTSSSSPTQNRTHWTPPPILTDTLTSSPTTTDQSFAPREGATKKPFIPSVVKKNSKNGILNNNHHHHHTASPRLLFKRLTGHKNDTISNHQFTDPPPPVSLNDNSETDRYGFNKATQWLSIEEYHEFEIHYQPILDRRMARWHQLLQDNDQKFPEKSPQVRRYVRKGIPPQLRGKAWLHYSGAEAKMAANPGVYDKFVNKAEQLGDENEFADIIKRDLHRTFPDNIQYRSSTTTATTTTTTTSSASHSQASSQPPIISALQRVLSAFSLYSPSIGYCQSLNYIVGMLLLFMPEEEAFWTLVTIIQNILPAGVYDVTMEGSSIDQTVLMMLLWERMPHIWSKVADKKSFWDSAADGASMPSITLVTNHWFLTLFINVLPVETVLRVWDCFFYEGSSVLFRVALTLFKLSEPTIMNLNDSLEIFQVVQNMPKKMIDCQWLMKCAFSKFRSLTNITEEDLERRREVCRERRRSGHIPQSRTLPSRRHFPFEGKLKHTRLHL